MKFKVVEFGSELYKQSVALREKILRYPLGLHFTSKALEQDKNCIHIVALDNKKVIGTTVLNPIDKDTIKIRQVAVDYDYRKQNIGKKLMEYAEEVSRKRGYKTAILHARYYVIKFYQKLGYKDIGDEFIEIGIPHLLMIKNISD